jgi:hypothetical protein
VVDLEKSCDFHLKMVVNKKEEVFHNEGIL